MLRGMYLHNQVAMQTGVAGEQAHELLIRVYLQTALTPHIGKTRPKLYQKLGNAFIGASFCSFPVTSLSPESQDQRSSTCAGSLIDRGSVAVKFVTALPVRNCHHGTAGANIEFLGRPHPGKHRSHEAAN